MTGQSTPGLESLRNTSPDGVSARSSGGIVNIVHRVFSGFLDGFRNGRDCEEHNHDEEGKGEARHSCQVN